MAKENKILLTPTGRLSRLIPKKWKLVRTPEFKAWFGDWENDPQNASSVVDENGEPLVVYHGTFRGYFDIFEGAKDDKTGHLYKSGAIYFHSNPRGADFWANTGWGRGWHGSVYPVYLNIKKPAIFRKGEDWNTFKKTIN
ncbi:MAG: hypothetical protein WCT77_11385, partial [Bacteroidota bacterium]